MGALEIRIDDKKMLYDLKSEFSNGFPYLKIEFFDKAHDRGAGSPKHDMITENKSIGQVRKKHGNATLSIHPDLRVGDVEQSFEKLFGVHVQVFRKSGKVWLETTATDKWTLAEQNETGREMSTR